MKLSVIILAAGQGTRMRSKQPKVLHAIAGKSMLERVVNTAQQLNPEEIFVIYGYQGDLLRKNLAHLDVTWVEQKEQLGTGHAVMQATPKIADDHRVLVLYGDVPLISQATLEKLIKTASEKSIGMITADLEDPAELGRIVRDQSGNFIEIVEYKDATEAQRNITEINSGIYSFPARHLKSWLPKLSVANAQKEYYLTDVLSMAVQEGVAVATVFPESDYEVMGVNDRVQLATLERYYQEIQTENLMRQGVTMLDPTRVDIRGDVLTQEDVTIDINVIFEGQITLGRGSIIEPNCIIKNSWIGENVLIKANSILEDSRVEAGCHVGPFARLRPGTHMQAQSRVGNFVEIKKSDIGENSKINHLSYIGDATVGKNVNIGAGTITCNYDGVNKHQTLIGDGAFIGSGTELVAPVEVGEGAFIGAGSTITQNAPSHELTLARSKQQTIKGWKAAKE
ncbi:MAG: bifunctional UDP-N-acetylglucosamine diphosphorylase/glucosamine-1-phosphate N-acetyltransferase GlmU [Pseudomonadota bacterium]